MLVGGRSGNKNPTVAGPVRGLQLDAGAIAAPDRCLCPTPKPILAERKPAVYPVASLTIVHPAYAQFPAVPCHQTLPDVLVQPAAAKNEFHPRQRTHDARLCNFQV